MPTLGDVRKNFLGTQYLLDAEMDRLRYQVEFARQLAELHPHQAGKWRKLIDAALEGVQTAMASAAPEVLRKAVRQAESVLEPIAKVAKSYTLHCVGHAHIDMNWMWSWPETVAVVNDSLATVLKLMEEFPTFKFSQSQASIYRIVQEHNPEMFARIKQRVKEGRWEVTASHWVENDKNMAGAESLCRHLLYTREYFAEVFDLKPEDVPIDFSPDTFGHAVTVPTYLNRGAIKYYYLHRPGIYTPGKPPAFWWQAPDGSRVLVKNDMQFGYNGQILPTAGEHVLNFVKETGGHSALMVYGVGDHGGGPTRRDLAAAVEMDAWPVFPRIQFSTTRAFFESLEKESSKLPTLTCELNTELTGCYTTQTLIKKANRYGENKLADAEIAAAMAMAAVGFVYPADRLDDGWRDTLFSHFHDILPGSGVHDTRTFTHGLFQKTMAMTSMVETRALRLLASKVDTQSAAGNVLDEPIPQYLSAAMGGGAGIGASNGAISRAEQSDGSSLRPFVVFNPLAQARAEVIEATVWDHASSGPGALPMKQRSWVVRFPDGKEIPPQMIESGTSWAHDFCRLALPISVPSLGYATFTIIERSPLAEASATPPAAKAVVSQLGYVRHCAYIPEERSAEGLENSLLRVELNPVTGGIRRLIDKRSGLAIIDQEDAAPQLEYLIERHHAMSAWVILDGQIAATPRLVSLKRTHAGPWKVGIELQYQIAESAMSLTLELRADDPQLYISIAGTWFQRGGPAGFPMLRLSLPLAIESARGRYEIPFGAIDRDINNGQELPALQWAQVNGKIGTKKAGCLLSNDCKYGHSLEGNIFRLTLIRSSVEPDPLPEIGRHEVALALRPFAGELPIPDAIRTGNALNHPLRVIGTDVHPGTLPTEVSFITLEPGNLILLGVKKAQSEDALIIRICEVQGRETTAVISLDMKLLGKLVSAVETDLMERPLEESTAKIAGSTIRVAVPSRGITTVMVKLKG